MQPEPDPSEVGDPDADDAAGQGAAGRSRPGDQGLAAKRPAAQELDAALLSHRQDPANTGSRDALLLLLYRAVAVQARELVSRQFGSLAHREDELVLRTMARIEGQDQGQLLADYEFGPAARSIYNYVQQKTGNIARNMQAEAYLPDGGFRSKDLKARLAPPGMAGQTPLRSGMLIEVPIAPADDDNDPEAPVPDALRRSETPMRHSVLRVNALARKLEALAQDMPGKTVSSLDEQGQVVSKIRLSVNHQRIWRAWLGLSHPDLIDLAEEELAHALGISKASVTRDTSAAFAYMLQHPDLRSLLALMEPNRFQSGAAAAKLQDAKLDELEAALRGPHGKGFFRKCVHQWLGEHV